MDESALLMEASWKWTPTTLQPPSGTNLKENEERKSSPQAELQTTHLNCLLCEEEEMAQDKKVYLLSIATLRIALNLRNLKHLSHSFCGLEMGCGLAGSSALASPAWCQPTFQPSWSLFKLDWGRAYNQDHSCGCSENCFSQDVGQRALGPGHLLARRFPQFLATWASLQDN